MCSITGRSSTGTIGLVISYVSGRRRVPSPAARTIALIVGARSAREHATGRCASDPRTQAAWRAGRSWIASDLRSARERPRTEERAAQRSAELVAVVVGLERPL